MNKKHLQIRQILLICFIQSAICLTQVVVDIYLCQHILVLIIYINFNNFNYFDNTSIHNMILSFRVSISKNKNIGHEGKETGVMIGLPIQNKNDAIHFVTFLVYSNSIV